MPVTLVTPINRRNGPLPLSNNGMGPNEKASRITPKPSMPLGPTVRTLQRYLQWSLPIRIPRRLRGRALSPSFIHGCRPPTSNRRGQGSLTRIPWYVLPPSTCSKASPATVFGLSFLRFFPIQVAAFASGQRHCSQMFRPLINPPPTAPLLNAQQQSSSPRSISMPIDLRLDPRSEIFTLVVGSFPMPRPSIKPACASVRSTHPRRSI